jgi:hypothetical protein
MVATPNSAAPFERVRTEPGAFFITEHYRDHPWVLVRMAQVTEQRMRELLEDAWQRVAPKKLRGGCDSRATLRRRSGGGDNRK